MDHDLEHRISVVVGLFVIASLASAYFHGWNSIVVCIIGLFVFAAILQMFCGGTGGR
jgi:ABC-type multidrug transport system permease subunit